MKYFSMPADFKKETIKQRDPFRKLLDSVNNRQIDTKHRDDLIFDFGMDE